MNTLLSSIMLGISNFPFFAVLFTLPIFAIQFIKYRKLNPVRIVLNYAIILYSLCLLALVFFPLPDPEKAATLNTHYIQLIPFHFIADIARENPLVLSDISTYIPALFHDTILQVVFNIIMTIPFGMFLRYYFKLNKKTIILLSLTLTMFIEIGQLTGLFFIYKGSYRFCDIDDIMTNTLGGYLGYKLIYAIENFIPSVKTFDINLKTSKKIQVL